VNNPPSVIDLTRNSQSDFNRIYNKKSIVYKREKRHDVENNKIIKMKELSRDKKKKALWKRSHFFLLLLIFLLEISRISWDFTRLLENFSWFLF
jgi:hypothetical protein